MVENASGNWPGVANDFLAILRCRECHSRLDRRPDGLVCFGWGKQYPALNGVVRLVHAQAYAGSFGFQWKIHARMQMDDANSHRTAIAFRQRRGFRPEDLAGKLVLDLGCGMGRFAEVATRWGAHVAGIDLSLASEVAAVNLADRNAAIFQADVFHLPFAEGSFDFIYSIGVFNPTPSCEQAVKVLPKLLKPGGALPSGCTVPTTRGFG